MDSLLEITLGMRQKYFAQRYQCVSRRVRLKVMHTNSAMLEITPGVQGLPCLHNPIARQALHSRITFNRTLSHHSLLRAYTVIQRF